MSSLLVLQDKNNIIMASDTASSINIDGVSYRVSDDEKKIFIINGYKIFASGQKHIRDLFISIAKTDEAQFNPIIAETILQKYFRGFDEYSLEVVIAEKLQDSTCLYFLSSYNSFTLDKNVSTSEVISMYTAGVQTKNVADTFENEYMKSSKLIHSILRSFAINQTEEVGGSVEIHHFEDEKIQLHKLPFKSIRRSVEQQAVSLIIAERIIGKLIMGNRLIIEDENGIIRLSGSIQEIFDREGIVKVALGEFAPNKYGLKINDGAIDLSTDDAPDSGLKLDKDGIRTFSPTGKKTFEVDAATGTTSIIGSLSIKSTETVNRGVVLDGNGIRGYKLDGTETFKIDNSGNASFGGELKAASGTFTGTLSGVDGTFSGTLSGVNGTFTTLSSGTIDGATIKGGTIEGTSGYFGSITGGTVTGLSINISDSATIGQSITIGKGFDALEKGVYFKGSAAGITAYGDSLNLHGAAIIMNGSVIFNSTVEGLYPVFG